MSPELRSLGASAAGGANFYDADLNLQFEVAHRVDPKDRWRTELWLRELGRIAGNELSRLARWADVSPPTLRRYDGRGHQIGQIEYHHSYRAMELLAFGRFALAAMSHRPGLLGWPVPVPAIVKYALSYVFVEAEFGLYSAVSLTDMVARAVRRFGSPALRADYLPRLTSTDAEELWQGAVAISEPQAGSDLGGLATVARRDGEFWRLHGEKCFCSNPDADLVLVLARTEGATGDGLSFFLVPRVLPDGRANQLRINRLRESLGCRSIAVGEITLDGAMAHPIGNPLDPRREIADLMAASQVSGAMRFAALMRRAFHEAVSHATVRRAFGQRLIDLPLLRVNITDLLLDVEAATAVVMLAAQTLDRADAGDEESRAFLRILAPLAKHAICRRARQTAAEAMEVLGGVGCVEDSVTARLVRDAHLGSIWDGTSNIVALGILRAIHQERGGTLLETAIGGVLDTCRHPGLEQTVRDMRAVSQQVIAQAAEVAARRPERRDPLARSIADSLYALVASVVLLQEAQWQLEEGSARKLLVARLYTARRLRRDAGAGRTPVLADEQFEALFQWTSLSVAGAAPKAV